MGLVYEFSTNSHGNPRGPVQTRAQHALVTTEHYFLQGRFLRGTRSEKVSATSCPWRPPTLKYRRLPIPPLSPLHPVWSPSNSFVSPGGRLLWKPPSAEIALWVSGCAWLPPSDLGLWSRGKGEGRLRLEPGTPPPPPQPLELPCRATKCFLGGQIRIWLGLRPTGPPLMTVVWLRAGRGSPLESETLRGTASWGINACPELGLGGFSMFFWPLFPGPHLAHRSNLGKLNG